MDLAGEIGQLIDREEAAIRARQEAVVNREFVAQQMPTLSRLDGIDIADDVGNCHVRRRQLLNKARIAIHPGNRRWVLMQLDRLSPIRADGIEWIVVDFRAGDDRNEFVQQISKLTNDSALRLAAQSQQN